MARTSAAPPPSSDTRKGENGAQRRSQRAGQASRIAERMLTLAEALTVLQVPKSTFFRWKAIGIAPKTIKLPNGSLRIRQSDLDKWLANLEEGVTA